MRMMRLGAALVGGALGASMLAGTLSAQEQMGEMYPATLQFGTGLINIPVAWVSPRSGDIWVTSSGKHIPSRAGASRPQDASEWNTNGAIETHWLGRISLGVSLYSQNPEWGVFGRALVVDERDFRHRPGLGWMPSIAVGVRNVGTFHHEDRLLLGHDVQRNAAGAYVGGTTAFAQGFHSTPTVYAVGTKSFQLGTANASLTAGYGNGLFSDDGGLGTSYNDKGQIAAGLFFGGRIAVHPSRTTTLMFLGENDGWDWNAGVVGGWRGISIGVYGTELEEGARSPAKGPLYQLYNYTKLNVAVGLNTNLFDIARGSVLRARIDQLEHEQKLLRGEVGHRAQRIAALQTALQEAQAGEPADDVSRRRQALEAQIQEERDAIQRAEARLRKIQERRDAKTSQVGVVMPPSK